MSIVVNLPAAGAATVPVAGATTAPAPQLSKRALAELKKGAMVEVWVECKPFTIQFGGVEKVESRVILCSVHRPLIDHFSPKWKRELAENDKANRVHAPFPKEPVKLIVGWMMAGGGKDLGTAADPYPKFDLRKLEILKSVATHLEIDSLVELITKDIVAATPVLPEAKTKIAPKKEIIRPVRLCYFCQKPGHIQRHCPERYATWVTKSDGDTYDQKGNLITKSKAPQELKVEPVVKEGVTTKATGPAAEASAPKKPNLRPVYDGKMAVDEAGTQYYLTWSRFMVYASMADGGFKITGTGTASKVSW